MAYEKREKKDNLFYQKEALHTINKLKIVQSKIQLKLKQFEKEFPGQVLPFQQFYLMKGSQKVCAASKKLFADIQKYISKLDESWILQLIKEACIRKIYRLGTTEAHEVPEQLPIGGELQSITSETIYNLLIEQDFLSDLHKSIENVSG